jgi:hypothetical protein
VDGESNPMKKVLPKSFSRWVDSNDTAEWLVHDYLYGAETDPKNPLAVPLTIQQKDSVFQDVYRRAGLGFGEVFRPTADQNATNDYISDEMLERLERLAGKGSKRKVFSVPARAPGGEYWHLDSVSIALAVAAVALFVAFWKRK